MKEAIMTMSALTTNHDDNGVRGDDGEDNDSDDGSEHNDIQKETASDSDERR